MKLQDEKVVIDINAPDNATRRFAFLLMKNFTLLSFASAVDALRIANRMSDKAIYSWVFLSEDGNPVSCSAGTSFNVDNSLIDLHRDDTIMVCGGMNISETTNWRISWIITLQYDTTIDQLKKIRDEIDKYISTSKDYKISDNTMHAVRIDKFSDSSIDMYVRCFTNTDKWSEWLKVKERLAIAIKEIVEKNKASFAFPSQSIYVEKK